MCHYRNFEMALIDTKHTATVAYVRATDTKHGFGVNIFGAIQRNIKFRRIVETFQVGKYVLNVHGVVTKLVFLFSQ